VFTADKFWASASRVGPLTALLVLYRAAFFSGTSRWIAWSLWAHVVHHHPYDISWGGPHWVTAAHSPRLTWPQLVGMAGIVTAVLAIAYASRHAVRRRALKASRSET
jgi:hypothetical protein